MRGKETHVDELNYETELCTATSGAYYAEIYAIGLGRQLIHRTARHDTEREARAEAEAWLMLSKRAATMARYAEEVPAA